MAILIATLPGRVGGTVSITCILIVEKRSIVGLRPGFSVLSYAEQMLGCRGTSPNIRAMDMGTTMSFLHACDEYADRVHESVGKSQNVNRRNFDVDLFWKPQVLVIRWSHGIGTPYSIYFREHQQRVAMRLADMVQNVIHNCVKDCKRCKRWQSC